MQKTLTHWLGINSSDMDFQDQEAYCFTFELREIYIYLKNLVLEIDHH